MTPSQKNEKALAALKEAKRIINEIHDELYGHNFQVEGWHLNGNTEPLDNWFDQNNWGVNLDEAIAALSQPTMGETPLMQKLVEGYNKSDEEYGKPTQPTPLGGEVVTVDQIADKLFIEFDSIPSWTRREIAKSIQALIQSRVGGTVK